MTVKIFISHAVDHSTKELPRVIRQLFSSPLPAIQHTEDTFLADVVKMVTIIDNKDLHYCSAGNDTLVRGLNDVRSRTYILLAMFTIMLTYRNWCNSPRDREEIRSWNLKSDLFLENPHIDLWGNLSPNMIISGNFGVSKSAIIARWVGEELHRSDKYLDAKVIFTNKFRYVPNLSPNERERCGLRLWRMLLLANEALWAAGKTEVTGAGTLITIDRVLTSHHVVNSREERARDAEQKRPGRTISLLSKATRETQFAKNIQSAWSSQRVAEGGKVRPIANEEILKEIRSVPTRVIDWEELLHLPKSGKITTGLNTTKLRKAFFGVPCTAKAGTAQPLGDLPEKQEEAPYTDITQCGNTFSPSGLAAAFFGQPRTKAEPRRLK